MLHSPSWHPIQQLSIDLKYFSIVCNFEFFQLSNCLSNVSMILKLPKLGYKGINKFLLTIVITLFSPTFRYTFDNNFLLNMIKCFLCQAWKLIVSFYFGEMGSKQKWQINLSEGITTSKNVCFLLSFTIWFCYMFATWTHMRLWALSNKDKID